MANFFTKIMQSFNLGAITTLGSGSVDQAVGVDIGTSSIKLVELKKKNGKAVLETYSTLALGPYANQDVGSVTNLSTELLTKAITDALREGSIATTNAAFSIPSSASLVFCLIFRQLLKKRIFQTLFQLKHANIFRYQSLR